MARAPAYAELHCHSAFTMLDGASSPEELVARAIALGLPALALTDQDDLGGAVRFQEAAREAEAEGKGTLHTVLGAEMTIAGSGGDLPASVGLQHLTLLVENERGWRNLSALVTAARDDGTGQAEPPRARLRPRGEPLVDWDQLAARADGLVALTGCPRGPVAAALRGGDRAAAARRLGTLADLFPGRLYVEVWDHDLEDERRFAGALLGLARAAGLPALVTNDVHYAAAAGRAAHDVLTCLKHGVTLDAAGTRLRPNGEFHLKSAAQMAARWFDHPALLACTVAVAERCRFALRALAPALPAFRLDPDDPDTPARFLPGGDPDNYPGDMPFLRARVWEGARARYRGKAPGSPEWRQLEHELGVIERLGLAGYFLIVWDVVRYCARAGILCQGRGSAANSAVCYCLGITAIDPVGMELLFERFLSDERNEAPDIDLDIAHREREQVLQYVYRRYGRERAALVCETICFRARSAVRDAARVLGFSVEQAGALADEVDGWIRVDGYTAYWEEKYPARDAPPTKGAAGKLRRPGPDGAPDAGLRAAGVDPADYRVRTLAEVVRALEGLPRHRSIHVGGFVLTDGPLGEVVPIEPASMADRTVIQWDKDDLEPVGLVKIDLLGLGMLTVLQDVFALLRARGVDLALHTIPMDDAAVYDQIS
ncbi:MAG TPA: PHP domain-containing protein, partial [Myxococcota bacterium]|nr:PHP domain-containing protein [Myxococcota bacterium]